MSVISAILELLSTASCATYNSLINDPKLGSDILKILTESAHNYLFQDLPELSERQRARLH